MIELEDLKIGDIVWFGRLEFGKRFSCIRSLFCRVKIININNYCISFESIDYTLSQQAIYVRDYGIGLSNSLYETEEDLKDDWNSCVLNEIDALTSYYQKRLELIKKKIKE